MQIRTFGIIVGILALLSPACLFAQEPATTQPTEYDGRLISKIDFIGAPNSSPDVVRSKMKTSLGKPFKQDVLDEDIRFLVEKVKLFSTIEVRILPDGAGVRLEFYVTENPRIVAILFLGNLEYDRPELMETITSREGGLADDITLKLDEKAIRDKYVKDGFHFVQVRHERKSEEFGSSVVFHITEGEEVDIAEVVFIGNRSFDDDELSEAMPKTGTGNFLFGQEYIETDVDADLVQLEQFYRGKGFLDATATLVDRTYNADKTEVTITIEIKEGEPYVVRSVAIEGMTRFDPAVVIPELETKVGDRYESFFKIFKDVTELRKKYYDEAYVNVRIADGSIVHLDTREVEVIFRIVEGVRVSVGAVEIRGNTETKDKIIRRALDDLVPGAPLNINTLNKAKQRLVSLNYFSRESLDIIKPDIGLDDFEVYKNAYLSVEDTDRENVKNLVVNVEEADTGSLQFAVGVGSNAGVVGSIIYRKENFDPFDLPESIGDFGDAFTGGGQRLIIQLAPGTEQSQFSGTYQHPNIFDSEFQYSHSLFHRIFFRENWDETRTGMNIGVGRRFGNNISAGITYRLELVDVDDIDNDAGQIVFDFEGERLISSIGLNMTFSDLDYDETTFLPIGGYTFRPSYEYAGLGGDLEFHKYEATGEYYFALFEDSEGRTHLLYFTGSMGYAQEAGDTPDIPIYERYFAGGHGSIRGFDFRGVGPHTGDSPDGGKVLFTGSINYIFPIFEQILRGVLFLDGGTVSEDFDSDDLTNIRLSTGFGIRLTIPFLGPTPFALDFGIPLIKYDEDETRLISFSIERKF